MAQGWGGTPLFKPQRYVLPQRVGVLWHFDLKTGIDLAYLGLELGMVFKRTTEGVCTYLSFQFQMTKKERKICHEDGLMVEDCWDFIHAVMALSYKPFIKKPQVGSLLYVSLLIKRL